MQSIKIMTGGPYDLHSYGNGTAYCLELHGNDEKPETPWSIFVQGDDATQFREEIAAIEAMHPAMPTRDVLGQMWATYWQGEA
ncbi:hypothetical protein [Novosphingobium sp.]|uniref:hypothetical protein n=1 Tax=Novosphingobium sp. TaxID=1874826 RepID=UPI00286E1E16|nr:hypothetical protein [Novosphingobium sp.]